ncbi:hypothetical protein K450DRAFT_254455 [Umbelopsis ramanniana AG]|uniref:Uncharacterized protein n=1 Tax=Umbelopsis ramanniana AG TaxID=1314678 RepID=A0AAD5E5V4_UMBRA|nr:uncharacterized protein K450DRAFT_254455 [Umbelopsis ramanniana AG]KAI8576965.1 hypothetical protein K450DRAFT_254455 [Umbelopsis ramanniana AG]
MCDLNWCPVCETAISPHSSSLYCSHHCFQLDALGPSTGLSLKASYQSTASLSPKPALSLAPIKHSSRANMT